MNKGLFKGFGGGLPIPQSPVTITANTARTEINWNQSSYVICNLIDSATLANTILSFRSPPVNAGFVVLELINTAATVSSSLGFAAFGNILSSVVGTYLPTNITGQQTAILTFFYDGLGTYYYVADQFTDGNYFGVNSVNFGASGVDFTIVFGGADPTIRYDHLLDALRLSSSGGGGVFIDDALTISNGIIGGLTVDTLTVSNGITATGGGITSQAGNISLYGTVTTSATVVAIEYSNDSTNFSQLQLGKSRAGSILTNSLVQSGDILGRILATGVNSSSAMVSTAYQQFVADGAPGASFVPGRVEWYMGTNVAAPALAMTLNSSGGLLLSSSNTQFTLNALSPTFQINGASNARASTLLAQWTNDATGPTTQYFKSRSASLGTNAVLTSADVIAKFDYFGVNSTPLAVLSASQRIIVDGSPGASFVPSRFEWWTGTNAAASQLGLSLNNAGVLVIGNSSTPITFNSLQGALQIQGTSNATSTASLQEFSADALGATIQFVKSRNAAIGSYTVLNSADVIGKIDFIGIASTTTNRVEAAYIQGVVDGSPSTTNVPGRLEFYTGTSSATPVLATTIDNAGRLLVSTSSTAIAVGALTSVLQIRGNTASTAAALYAQYTADAVGPAIQFLKSRGATIGTNTVVQVGDELGALDFYGIPGLGGTPTIAANIRASADAAITSGSIPSRIELWAGPSTNTVPGIIATFRNMSGAAGIGAPAVGQMVLSTDSVTTAFTVNSINAALQVIGRGIVTGDSNGVFAEFSNDTKYPGLVFAKSRAGTIGVAVALSSGDLISKFDFYGVNTTPGFAQSAIEQVVVDGAPGASFVPSRFEWYTGTAAAGPAIAMKLDSTKNLILSSGNLVLPSQGVATPSTPASATMTSYAHAVGNRIMLGSLEPSGQHATLQPHFGRNNVMMWDVVLGTLTPSVIGTPAATAVTGNTGAATPALASTNFFTRKPRLNVSTSTTAGQVCGWYSTTNLQGVTLGTAGTPIDGGFHLVFRFGFSDTVASPRAFVGLSSDTTTATNVDPATMTNCIGVAQISTDATQLYIVFGGSAAQTAIALGTNFPPNTSATDIYELVLFAPENSNNTVYYQVSRLNSTVTPATGTLTGTAGTALPANTTFLYPRMWRTNNATAAAVTLSLFGMYLETDN
jgi:hypothetical protein